MDKKFWMVDNGEILVTIYPLAKEVKDWLREYWNTDKNYEVIHVEKGTDFHLMFLMRWGGQ